MPAIDLKTFAAFVCFAGAFFSSLQSARASQVNPYTGQCANLGIDKSNIVSKQIFPVTLMPYGDVCFVAHSIPDPLPGDPAEGFKPEETPYIALSLFQNGKDIHDLSYPNTPDYEWPPAIDDVAAVAFKKLDGSKHTDIIVIGHSLAADGDDLYHPMVYLGSKQGFVFDHNLSDTLFEGGYSTVPDVLRKIEELGTIYVPPPPQ